MQTQRAAPVMKMQRPHNIITRMISALFWGIAVLALQASWLWWQRGYIAVLAYFYPQIQTLQLSITQVMRLQPYYSYPFTLFQSAWQNCQHFFTTYFHFPTTHSAGIHWMGNVFLQKTSVWLKQAGIVLLCILQTIGLKCLLLLAALPLFSLALLVGLSDGLMQRAIRTASLGRESAYLFHQFSQYSLQLIFLAVLLFLILPITRQWSGCLLLLAALMGLASAQVVSRFKKYL